MTSLLQRPVTPALPKSSDRPHEESTLSRDGFAIALNYFILAWVFLCALLLLIQRFRTPTVVSFQIAVREAAPGPGMRPCFYYDTGAGFSERETTCFDYDRDPVKQFQTYRIAFPTRLTIQRLRFDPLQEPGNIAIRNVSIGRYRFTTINLKRAMWNSLYALNAAEFSFEDHTLVARLSTNDPYLMLADNVDSLTDMDGQELLLAAGIALLICIGVVVLMALVRRTRARPHDDGAPA